VRKHTSNIGGVNARTFFDRARSDAEVLRLLQQTAENLFQPLYYQTVYPGIDRTALSPFEHYRQEGGHAGKNPNSFLYSSWYLRTYPDVAETGLSPLDHYFLYGAERGYDPGPRFSTKAYYALYPEVAKARLNPLIHYFRVGMGRGYTYILANVGAIIEQNCRASAKHPENFGLYIARPFLSRTGGETYREFVAGINTVLPDLQEEFERSVASGNARPFADRIMDAAFNKVSFQGMIVHASRPLLMVGSDTDSLALSFLIMGLLNFFLPGNTELQRAVLGSCSDGWRRHPLVMQSAALLDIACLRLQDALDTGEKAARMPGYMHIYNEIHLRAHDAAFAAGIVIKDSIKYIDCSDKFCSIPFRQFMFEQGGGERIYNFLCNSCWSPFTIEAPGTTVGCSIDAVWNSFIAQEIRRSILDGDFSYCDRAWCAPLLDAFSDQHMRQCVVLPASAKAVSDDNPISLVEFFLNRCAVVVKEILNNTDYYTIIKNNQVILPYLPQAITSSLDPSCNLQCPSCRDEKIFLSKQQSSRVRAFYDAYIYPVITSGHQVDYAFDGSGEALVSRLGRHTLQSLGAARPKNLTLTLRTNGFALNRHFWEHNIGEARHLIRHIRVSIDGASKETYEKLRWPSTWEALCANMAFMGSMIVSGELQVLSVVMILRDDNYFELPELAKLCQEWHVESLTFLRYQNKVNENGEYYDDHDVLSHKHKYYEYALDSIRQANIYCTENNIRLSMSSTL
jgi:sulfatase maturation enzyme AslB (radical SAM superfamily)